MSKQALEEQLLMVEEIAAGLRVQVSTVRYWIRSGKLPAVKLGRRLMIYRGDLEKFVCGCRRLVTVSVPKSTRH